MAREESRGRQRKNVNLRTRRTSVSLEEQVWDGLADVCRREQVSLDALCTAVDELRVGSSMSSALRVFVLTYYREVAEAGQARSGETAPRANRQPRGISGTLPSTFDRFHSDQTQAMAS